MTSAGILAAAVAVALLLIGGRVAVYALAVAP